MATWKAEIDASAMAAELAALRAENERLRGAAAEALRHIKLAHVCTTFGRLCEHLNAAAAALAGSSGIPKDFPEDARREAEAQEIDAPPRALQEQDYTVQFLLVKEISVKALNDIQAEKLAYLRLTTAQKDWLIGSKVLEPGDGSGARNPDHIAAMNFVREHMGAIDEDFLQSD